MHCVCFLSSDLWPALTILYQCGNAHFHVIAIAHIETLHRYAETFQKWRVIYSQITIVAYYYNLAMN